MRGLGVATLLLLLGVPPLTGCGAGPSVERKRGEFVHAGRFVTGDAYANYAIALRAEKTGDDRRAVVALRRALVLDPEGGALYAALGRITCKTSWEDAERIFSRGLERAVEKAPLWLARAECAARHDRAEKAHEHALEAIACAPEAPVSEAATRVAARALVALGRHDEARALWVAHELFVFGRVRPALDSYLAEDEKPVKVASARFLDALERAELHQVRVRATGLVTPGELALALLAVERRSDARTQAEFVLASDGDEPNARLTLALTDERGFTPATSAHAPSYVDESALDGPPAESEGVAQLGWLLVARHLGRVASLEAARAFARALPKTPDEGVLGERVRREIEVGPRPSTRVAPERAPR